LIPTAVCPLLALNATAGGPSVHTATAVAPAVRVTPLRKNAVSVVTPVIKQFPGRVILAVLVVKLVVEVELYGL
jgi:hypothetical protein